MKRPRLRPWQTSILHGAISAAGALPRRAGKTRSPSAKDPPPLTDEQRRVLAAAVRDALMGAALRLSARINSEMSAMLSRDDTERAARLLHAVEDALSDFRCAVAAVHKHAGGDPKDLRHTVQSELFESLADIHPTWCGKALEILTEAGYAKGVFLPGGASAAVAHVEKTLGQRPGSAPAVEKRRKRSAK